MLIKLETPQVSATAAEALRYKKLEEKLALFRQITLCYLCPGNSGRVVHIFIFGDELIALMPVSFRKVLLHPGTVRIGTMRITKRRQESTGLRRFGARQSISHLRRSKMSSTHLEDNTCLRRHNLIK